MLRNQNEHLTQSRRERRLMHDTSRSAKQRKDFHGASQIKRPPIRRSKFFLWGFSTSRRNRAQLLSRSSQVLICASHVSTNFQAPAGQGTHTQQPVPLLILHLKDILVPLPRQPVPFSQRSGFLPHQVWILQWPDSRLFLPGRVTVSSPRCSRTVGIAAAGGFGDSSTLDHTMKLTGGHSVARGPGRDIEVVKVRNTRHWCWRDWRESDGLLLGRLLLSLGAVMGASFGRCVGRRRCFGRLAGVVRGSFGD